MILRQFNMRFLFTISIFLFKAPLLVQAQYVVPKILVLKKSPDKTAPVVGNLSRGIKVKVMSKKSTWLNIKTKSVQGWVPKFFIKKTPLVKVKSIFKEGKDLNSKARKRASAFVTAGAARGLQEQKNTKIVFKSSSPESLKRVKSYYSTPQPNRP